MARGTGIHFFLGALVALVCGTVQAQSGHYALVNLGTLPGGDSSNGFAINNLGEVAGRSTTDEWYYHGFFWSESTGMVDLRTLGGSESEGWGINDHSQVVGETTDGYGHWHAFLWEAGVIQSAYTAGYGSGAWTINNDGLIVGWNDSIFGTAGFVRHPDGTVYLGQPGSEFYDINNPAAGEAALAGGFWRTPGTGVQSPVAYDTGLNSPTLSPNGGLARGINRDGTLVGYQGNLPMYAKADSGYAVTLAPMVSGYTSGRFYKINDAGVMVGINGGALPVIGVIYAEGGVPTDINTLLDPATAAGWQVDTLRDINEHGYITGTGNIDGAERAIVLRPLDTDGDGLDYYEETYLHATDPDVADGDGDGLSDGEEIAAGTDPELADTDGDGTNDGQEVALGTDPRDPASNPSNEVNFPDANLQAAVRSAIGLPSGPITIGHLVGTGFTELNAYYAEIVNLSGLEYCRDLERLNLSGNGIYDLTPLAGLTNLLSLEVSETLIADLSPLSSLTELERLIAENNLVQSIDGITGLTNLVQLWLSGNDITELPDLTNLTSLELLFLSYNEIDSIDPVGALSTLRLLGLRECWLSNADALGNLTGLQYLDLSYNPIDSDDFLSNLTNMVSLQLEYCLIQDVDWAPAMPGLRYLTISINPISSIAPLTSLDGLVELGMFGTMITDITPLGELTTLEHLEAGRNFTSAGYILTPIANLTNLRSLIIDGEGLEDISALQNLTNLTYLSLVDNRIQDLSPLAGLTQLNWLLLERNRFTDLSPLAANPGLGAGDYINVARSPLSQTALCNDVPLLESRGAGVYYTGTCGGDKDGDGLADAFENLSFLRTNPNLWDTDGDGLGDGEEYQLGLSPHSVDSDDDGIQDGTEVGAGSDPNDPASTVSEVYVDVNSGNDSTGWGTRARPWKSITRAIRGVEGTQVNTVSICVAEGIYYAEPYPSANITLSNHQHLLGGYDASDWTRDIRKNETILDASLTSAVCLVRLYGNNCRFDGFTVTGWRPQNWSSPGGPIETNMGNRGVTIANCTITGNIMPSNAAGGISIQCTDVRILNCTIIGNRTTGNGGGINLYYSSNNVLIDSCVISGNTASLNGGGILDGSNGSVTISNSLISGNVAGFGGGGFAGGDFTVVTNCTIANNRSDAARGGGVYSGPNIVLLNNIFSGNQDHALVVSLGSSSTSNTLIQNNLFFDNPDGDFQRTRSGQPPISLTGAAAINANVTGATGNVDGDPLFSETAGVWTAVTQDSTADTLTLTDVSASFDPNALRHGLVALSPDGTIQAPILANTSTSIVISNEYLASLAVGSAYRIVDYHLEPGSAAIDLGIDTSAPEDGEVVVDFDGVARGFDGDGLGAATADGSDYDIGAYESDTPVDSITVLAPNGGETLTRGTPAEIRWSSVGNVGTSVKILIRRGTYTGTLFGSTPNDGVHTWNIPATYPINSGYTIEVVSVAHPAIGDASDAGFSIAGATGPAGTLTVSGPNGGESYLQGATVPITWSSTGSPGANVDILARRGALSIVLASATPNDGAFNWLVPTDQAPGLDYVIEVRSSSIPTITDTSNAAFAIEALPSLLLTAPNGGQTYLQGAVVPIAWSTTGNPGANVALVAIGGGGSHTIADSTPNDGAFDWAIPVNQAPGADYVIEVRSLTIPGLTDGSNAPFTINGGAPTDSITILSPNGGETLVRGTAAQIRWNSTGNVGGSVKIVIRRGTYTGTLFGSTPNDGVQTWNIPATYPIATGYTLEISSVANPAISDGTNSPFAIDATAPAGSITVAAPNGGETYTQGGIVPITWSSTGDVGANVEILAHGAGQTFNLAASTANDGAFDWAIPAGQATGTDYTIQVRSIANPALSDSSNAPFTINATAPTASITLTAPNGGETYYHGGVVPITWNSTGSAGAEVLLAAERSDGQVFMITTATPNDGAYGWTVPVGQPVGADYVITVRSLTVPNTGDSSNAPFTIAAPPTDSITVLSPNGGETFTRGTPVEIRWNSAGNVGTTVKIVIKRGTYTGTLFGSTPNDGVHTWTIPATYPVNSGFSIEISSVANPAIGDGSDGTFSIAAP